jgi:hypothetical protein
MAQTKPGVGPDSGQPSLELCRATCPFSEAYGQSTRHKKVPPHHPASTCREGLPQRPRPLVP